MSTTSVEPPNKAQRPNSIISVNSMSSGTSSSSGSCTGNSNRSGGGSVAALSLGQQNIEEEDVKQEPQQEECAVHKKQQLGGRKGFNQPHHHRSTRSTLVSQCSMGECDCDVKECPWIQTNANLLLISKESGIIDDISTTPDEVSEPIWSMKKLSLKSVDSGESAKSGQDQSSQTNQSSSSVSGSNPYINESVAVHL